MTYSELSRYIGDTIHQFIFTDNVQNNYQDLIVRIGNEQYFIDYMSQYALYNDTVYALCETHKVQEEGRHYIIVDARHPASLKAAYRINDTAAFNVSEQGEAGLDEEGLAKASELAKNITETLVQQSLGQLNAYAQKFKVAVRQELEQEERIVDLLKVLSENETVTYCLTGLTSIQLLHGDSIPQLINQYLEQCKQQLQPHELLALALPKIVVERSPEATVLYEKMDTNGKHHADYFCNVPMDLYLNLFEKQQKALASSY